VLFRKSIRKDYRQSTLEGEVNAEDTSFGPDSDEE
jgi:hypothetical protein